MVPFCTRCKMCRCRTWQKFFFFTRWSLKDVYLTYCMISLHFFMRLKSFWLRWCCNSTDKIWPALYGKKNQTNYLKVYFGSLFIVHARRQALDVQQWGRGGNGWVRTIYLDPYSIHEAENAEKGYKIWGHARSERIILGGGQRLENVHVGYQNHTSSKLQKEKGIYN